MTNSKLAQNILSQAESLSGVLQHQCGDGAKSLAQAASLLQSGKRVLITGMGASLFASIPLEYFLCSQGIDAVAVEAGELLHYRRAGFQDAVTVVVSRSGESIEITRILETLKGRTPVIGICNEPQSTLARNADVSISVGSLDDDYVAVQTYTGTVLAMHLLAGAVANTANAAREAAREILPAFEQLVKRSFDELTRWDALVNACSAVHLLGRGPSCASAYEGALLFNEVAKTAAVGMAAGSFRHGPVEVVDSNFLGFVFAPHGNTRELNLALASDLARFGGRVLVIGPSFESSCVPLEVCATPETAETLAPMVEIVPVQMASLRMAQLKGIPPGSFRYAPRVALDEAKFNVRKES
jgi:glucosamine--fructose-6-phosphate aminotransferase (isomerizing)